MHVALVVDPERLLTDGAALQRLAVALAAEGVRVAITTGGGAALPAFIRNSDAARLCATTLPSPTALDSAAMVTAA